LGRLRSQAKVADDHPVPDFTRRSVRAGTAPITGPQNAPITIVEFADFECPYCSQGHELLRQLRKLYPDKVKVVFRHFPLPQHQNARPAAEASYCAHQQGLFWQYHDLLFDHTNALGPSSLQGYAEKVGLDMNAFNACLASEAPKAAVRADEAAGREFGVDGTPSIYVNGIKLIGLLPLPLIRVIIDHELKQ
ncbi:MAG: DsbA family protein, partial [Myxococcota bacterium]|nr:DsbA family protein [Myxococcota bacterium]